MSALRERNEALRELKIDWMYLIPMVDDKKWLEKNLTA